MRGSRALTCAAAMMISVWRVRRRQARRLWTDLPQGMCAPKWRSRCLRGLPGALAVHGRHHGRRIRRPFRNDMRLSGSTFVIVSSTVARRVAAADVATVPLPLALVWLAIAFRLGRVWPVLLSASIVGAAMRAL